jgi:hypothetical protein
MASGNSWDFVNCGAIEIPEEFWGENFHFAFKYISDETVASTWEIKNLTLNAECNQVAVNDIIPQRNDIMIYPNPVEEILTVECAVKNVQNIEIYDLSGKLIRSTLNNFAGTTKIDVGQLKSGSYLLKIGNQIQKFIKK